MRKVEFFGRAAGVPDQNVQIVSGEIEGDVSDGTIPRIHLLQLFPPFLNRFPATPLLLTFLALPISRVISSLDMVGSLLRPLYILDIKCHI